MIYGLYNVKNIVYVGNTIHPIIDHVHIIVEN